MPDQIDLLEAELAHQLVDVAGDGAFVVTAERLGGIAEAAQVGRDDGIFRGQCRNDAAPFEPRLRPSVEQHHRLAAAGDHIMEPHVVERDGVMLENRFVDHGYFRIYFFSGSHSFCHARSPSCRVF
jgi:hypothetical protein